MAIVIADTSPLQYLFQVDLLHLLQDLFESVLVPDAVRDELQVGRSLGYDVPDLAVLPWIFGRPALEPSVANQFDLGAGERAVLALALELGEALVVLDDAAARAAAKQLGLTTTGTLGILLLAKEQHLIAAVVPVITKLEARGFRVTEPVRRRITELAGE